MFLIYLEEAYHELAEENERLKSERDEAAAAVERLERRSIELIFERDYLLRRSMGANRINFADCERDTGRSSNAMVYYAFGGPEPNEFWYPADASDLAACYRARNSAPPHLWPKMDAVLRKYEAAVTKRYPNAIEEAVEVTGGLKEAKKA